MKHRVPLILGGVSVALVLAASFGSSADAAGRRCRRRACRCCCRLVRLRRRMRRDAPTDRVSAVACARVRCAKAAANARAGVIGKAGATTAAGGAIVSSYENVSPSFDGIYQTDGTPPDTTGAVGPDRYIEAVNTSFGIFSRTGALLGSGDLIVDRRADGAVRLRPE